MLTYTEKKTNSESGLAESYLEPKITSGGL